VTITHILHRGIQYKACILQYKIRPQNACKLQLQCANLRHKDRFVTKLNDPMA